MVSRRIFSLAFPLALAAAPWALAAESAALVPHPRLIATAADWQQLAARRATDPALAKFIDLMLAQARSDVKLEPSTRTLLGRRLLGVSREFIRRNLLWAFAYRVTGEPQFLERARLEMLTVAAFSDWNPSHYLDVAEMTTGLAIGYDWLHQDLSPADRATIRRAIIDKGIAQARHGHKTFSLANNWSQVCSGGMVLGALAVQEDEPALAADLLAAVRNSGFPGLEAYKPDGVYPEGPGYWDYGTSYQMLLVAALRSSGQGDWGLMDAPGLKRSAQFYAQSISPTGRYFNYADGGESPALNSAIFYLARELNQATLADSSLAMIREKRGLHERFAPLIALWWPAPEKGASLPLQFSGQGPQPVSIWRSSWTDPLALYFGIKGGGAGHSHAHMDGGSFVLDLDGVRWAKDLGMQDYNSLESKGIDLWNMAQSSARWSVFRLGSDAHNTLTIDGAPHNAKGMATLRMLSEAEAQLDLTSIFQPGQVGKALRTARVGDATVSLADEISGARPGSSIRWAMNSSAKIVIKGNEAILSEAGRTLHVRFSGTPVVLEARDIAGPVATFDAANPNMRQLIAHAPVAADGSWKVAVRFSRD